MSNEMIMGGMIRDRGETSDRIGLEYPAGSGVEHLYLLIPYISMIMDGKYKICEGFNGFDPAFRLPPDRIVIIPPFWRTV